VRFAAPLDAAAIIANSVLLEGSRVRAPAPTHAALFTLLHAAKHLWGTLEIVLAISRLLESDDIDWIEVRTLAARAGSLRACDVGLALAGELYGGEGADSATGTLRDAAMMALRLPPGVFADRWSERRAHRAALDSWSARLRYDIWRVIAPTPLEWQWCPLPDALTALYGPLRVVRLGVAALKGRLRREPFRDSSDCPDRARA
jgi:hypothetical protein